MNTIYIYGIAILLVGGAHSLNGDAKTDESYQQKILLRKLQNFQETKPLKWNEFLADVLVNKIGIFSSQSQDKEDLIKDDAPISKEKNFLTDFFSKVLVVYKKFIYDGFVGKRKESDDTLTVIATPINPKTIENESGKIDREEVIRPTEAVFEKGPKSEVEIVEPKYHGKIILEDSTEGDTGDSSNKNTDLNEINTEKSEDYNNYDPNVIIAKEESGNNCAKGFVKSENGNCVNNSSRLILAVPNQCPIGYRKDWLGYCRKVFHF